MLKSSPPVPQNMTLFGDRVHTEVIKLKGGQSGGPSSRLTGVLCEKGTFGHRHTQREDSVKRWPSTSQGERPGQPLPAQPCPHLAFRHSASRTARQRISVVQATPSAVPSLQPQHTNTLSNTRHAEWGALGLRTRNRKQDWLKPKRGVCAYPHRNCFSFCGFSLIPKHLSTVIRTLLCPYGLDVVSLQR